MGLYHGHSYLVFLAPFIKCVLYSFLRRLIDLGVVDILHGHSSHHPLPVELYKGKVRGAQRLTWDLYMIIGTHRNIQLLNTTL